MSNTFTKTSTRTTTINGKTTTVMITVKVSGDEDPLTAHKLVDEVKQDMQRSIDAAIQSIRAPFDEVMADFDRSVREFFKPRR